MKNFCFLLLLVLSTNTFANADKWYGTYHYYSSEELSGGNVATIESVLTLTPKKCEGEFKHEVRQFQKPYDNQQAEQISLMV